MQFKTQITMSHDGDVFTFPTCESCNVTQSTSQMIPSFNFSVKIEKSDKDNLVDRFPPLNTEVVIFQGRPGNLRKTMCGYLKSPPKSREGSVITLEYSGCGYYDKTHYIIVNESYDNKTIDFIIKDLHSKYLPDFDIGVIEFSDKVISIRLSMEFLYDAFEKIAQTINFIPYIDNDKKFNFHSEKYLVSDFELTENPFTYERGSANFEDSADNLINQLYVIGGSQLSNTSVSQVWTCNGVDKTFQFNNKPIASLEDGTYSFKYNGNSIGSGIKGKDQFSSTIKILVDESNNTFETFETYQNGTIQATHRYKYPILDILNDTASQEKYGVISDKITISSDDRNYVLEQAQNKLNKYSMPITKGSIKPFEPLYSAGEIVLVNIPSLKINKYLKITSITYDSTPGWEKCSLNLESDSDFERVIKNLQKRISNLENANLDNTASVNQLFQSSDLIQTPTITETIENYTHILQSCSVNYFCNGGNYI